MGYAGTSLLLAVPSFLLSCATAYRLTKLENHPDPLPPPTLAIYTHAALTSLPPRRREHTSDSKECAGLDASPLPTGSTHPLSISPSSIQISKTAVPDKPGHTHTISRHLMYDTSVRQPSVPSSRRQSVQSHATLKTTDSPVQMQDRSRHASYQEPPSPIVFNSPSRTDSHAIIVNVSASGQGSDTENEKDDSPLHVRPYEIELASEDDRVSGSLHWAKDSDHASISKNAYDYPITADEEPSAYAFPPYPRIRRSLSGRKFLMSICLSSISSPLMMIMMLSEPPWLEDPPEPDPRLGCIVTFQILCSSTQVVAAVSTLIDIFTRRPTPTRVGTQHVALLLVSWIPSLMFCLAMGRRFLFGRPP